jgi:hypothetical protein
MAVSQSYPAELCGLLFGKPAHVDVVALTGSGAAVAYTIPAGCTVVVLSPYPKSADFLANANGTAARPSGGVTDGTASIPNPLGFRGLSPAGTLSLVAGTADVNVAVLAYREPGGPA